MDPDDANKNFVQRLHANDPTITSVSLHFYQGFDINQEIRFFEALAQNSVVETIVVSGLTCGNLATVVRRNPVLKRVDLSQVYISNVKWEAIGSALMVSNIRDVRCHRCFDKDNFYDINDAVVLALLDACTKMTVLDSLNFANNDLPPSAGPALIKIALQVQELLLGDNALDDAFVINLTEVLQHPRCRLARLSLYGNKKITDVSIHHLTSGLMFNTVLHTLDLDDNGLTDITAIRLGAMLTCNTTLRELYLNNNKFTSDGGGVIANSLKYNSTLKILQLGCNRLTNNSDADFGSMLKINQNLQVLFLHDNRLEFCCHIAKGVVTNTALKELDLDNNYLTSSADTELGAMLTINQTLQKLRVGGLNNRLGPCCAIASSLHLNRALQVLHLGHRGAQDMPSFFAALGHNKKLKSLDLNGYDCVDSDTQMRHVAAVNGALTKFNSNMTIPDVLTQALHRNTQYQTLTWTPKHHAQFLPACHCALACILLAAGRFCIVLPTEIWVDYIFSCFNFPDF